MKNVFTLVNIGFSPEITGIIKNLIKKSHMGIIIDQAIEGDSLSLGEVEFHLQEEYDLLILNSLGFSCPLVEIITFLKGKFPLTEIMVVTFGQNYQLAINAFRGGVRDIIEYPLSEEDFLSSLSRSLTYRSLIRRSENLTQILGLFNLFGDYRKFESKEQLFVRIDEFLRKKFQSGGLIIVSFPKSGRKGGSMPGRESVFWNENLFSEDFINKGKMKLFDEVDLHRFKSNEPQYLFRREGGEYYYFCNFGHWEHKQYVGIFRVPRLLEDEMMGYMGRILHNAFQQILHVTVEKELSHLVHSDDVTGLYNQRKLQVDIEKAIKEVEKEEGPFSILFIDIDHFKKINDANGHLVGSLVLGEVAHELRKIVRETDLIYRYGGDEFVVILQNTKKELARDVGQRIINTLKLKKFHGSLSSKDENTFHLSVSIGVAQYPEDAKTKEEILGLADKMMYKAKEGGRGQVRLVDEFYQK